MIPILTIGGSDASGGAGIQADIKAFAVLGLHGASALTCVVAENTRTVSSIQPVPLDVIANQIDRVCEEMHVKLAKTGMLYSTSCAELVAGKIDEHDLTVIVDPILRASTGASLMGGEGYVGALKRHVLPRAHLIAPNLYEASALVGFQVSRENDMIRASKVLHDMGCTHVLVKGGHLKGRAVDVFYDGEQVRKYKGRRSKKDAHGSGCTFTALIAGHLAKGAALQDAIASAKSDIGCMIERAYKFNAAFHTNQLGVLLDKAARYEVLHELRRIGPELEKLPPRLVAEVGMNLCYAMPGACKPADVAAFDRLRLVEGRIRISSCPGFGKSRHVARVALAAMGADKDMRAAMNVRFSAVFVESARALGYNVAGFDRHDEPRAVSTMSWGTERAIAQLGEVPDIIYDEGAIGKEPMIRVLGREPQDVVGKVKRIARYK